MMYVLILLTLVMFIYAVLGVTALGPYNDKFATLERTFWSLGVMLTQDGMKFDLYFFFSKITKNTKNIK